MNKSGKRLVFVCTVNRHRSVIAEFIFRRMLEDYRLDPFAVHVSSAGIVTKAQKDELRGRRVPIPRPLFGYRPMSCLIFYMQRKAQIDVTNHRSGPLTAKTVRRADFIIAMGESHKQGILATYPAAGKKVTTLAELSFPFQFEDIVAEEPPGLMPSPAFCMLKCDHWGVTDIVVDQIKERLDTAMPKIFKRLKISYTARERGL